MPAPDILVPKRFSLSACQMGVGSPDLARLVRVDTQILFLVETDLMCGPGGFDRGLPVATD